MTASVPEGVTCLDFMGRTVHERPVMVSPTPVYLIGPPGEAEALPAEVNLVQ